MEQFPFLIRKDRAAIRYLVVDDSVFARKNVARMVESFGGEIAGEAGDGCTAITEYDRTNRPCSCSLLLSCNQGCRPAFPEARDQP